MDNRGDTDPAGARARALRRLASMDRRRRIPYVRALAEVDGGAACLAMILGYHGKEVGLEQVRQVIGTGPDGATVQQLLEAARWHGLRGRNVRLDVEDLEYLGTASILHWDFNHFVVFQRLREGGVDIVDPSLGPRRVPMDQFRRSFTGVAVTFEPGENFQAARREPKSVWGYLRRMLRHSPLLSRILVTSVLIQVLSLALPLLTGILVDRVVPRGDYHLLTVLSAGFLTVVLFRFLASVVRAHLLLSLETHLDTQMTLDFVDHLVDLPYAFFQQRSAGDVIMRLNSNTTVLEILTSSTVSGLLDGALVSAYLLLLFATSLPMGLLALGLGLIRVAIFMLTRRRYRDLTSSGLQTQAIEQSYEVEMLAGIETLKASGVEHRAVEHWTNLFVDVMNVVVARGRLGAVVDSLMDALALASPLIILSYGGLQVLDGRLTLGTMLAVSALATGFLTPLSTLVSAALQLQLLGSYVERTQEVFDAPAEQDRDTVSRAGRLLGGITLEKVSFRYAPSAPLVVREVSAEILPGQHIAIVGRSGAGKSTLARLLLGLYPPTSGRILYDGVDLAGLESRSVRRQLGIVPQHPYLFGTTIRSNISLADPSLPLDRVIEAAKVAQIHDEILAMPMGYETVLVDGGASLAGGQRQRVALARALVHQPAILLFDEATSALDTVTETAVFRSLASLPCTRVVIAHRLSTIVDADLILVMENGGVVEQGAHGYLMGLHGRYEALVAAQIERPRAAR